MNKQMINSSGCDLSCNELLVLFVTISHPHLAWMDKKEGVLMETHADILLCTEYQLCKQSKGDGSSLFFITFQKRQSLAP